MIFELEKKVIIVLWKLSNDNQLFSNLRELAMWELVQFFQQQTDPLPWCIMFI
jgi:hypothetical protein